MVDMNKNPLRRRRSLYYLLFAILKLPSASETILENLVFILEVPLNSKNRGLLHKRPGEN